MTIPTPIWKGKFFSFTPSACPVDYVLVNASVPNILNYRGRVVAPPDGSQATLQLFDIIAPYCRQDPALPDAPSLRGYIENYALLKLRLTTYPAVGSASVQAFNVFADWSYGRVNFTPGPERTITSDPVRRIIDPRMPLIYSSIQVKGGSFLEVGGMAFETVQLPGSFDSMSIRHTAIGPGHEGEAARVRIVSENVLNEYGPTYTVRNTCARWALYYVNALGGWDFLVLDGFVRPSETYARESVELHHPVLGLADQPGSRVYLNRIGRTWELSTGWLNDAESERFGIHIPGTTQAYLYDMDRGEFLPVSIDDTEMQVDTTLRTNGHRPVCYTITVKLQQERFRM